MSDWALTKLGSGEVNDLTEKDRRIRSKRVRTVWSESGKLQEKGGGLSPT